MSKPVYNRTLNQETNGYVWSFENAAQIDGKVNLQQAVDLEPVIIGKTNSISGEAEIVHEAITLKHANELVAGIPDCLDQFREAAIAMTNNLYHTIGFHDFAKAQIGFIAQRTVVAPFDASRPKFSDWHTHEAERGGLKITYQLSDELQTEIGDKETDPRSAANGSIIRLGSAISHRSQTNISDKSIKRTWCAVLVYPKAPPKNTPANGAFSRANIANAVSISEALQSIQTVETFPARVLV